MARVRNLLLLLALTAAPVSAASPQPTSLKPAEKIAIWKAAGFSLRSGTVLDGCDQPKQPPIERRDLNGDGVAEVIVTDDGTCYGMTAAYFAILTPNGPGKWRSVIKLIGIPSILKTRAKGWPDIEVGGPGFCFPVWRYDGKAYDLQRHEYEGKPCKPSY